MPKLLALFFALLLIGIACYSQDTLRIKTILDSADYYLDKDNDSAIYYNKSAERLIDQLHAESYRHHCYHSLVKDYHAKFDYRSALDYCLKSIHIARDSFQMATSYRALFNLYYNIGEKDSAIKYAVYSQQLTERIGDTANLAANYGNLCRLYKNLYQYDRAIEYGKKGIDAGERYHDTKSMLISMNNLGNCYMETGRYHEAIDLFTRQKEIGKQIHRKRSVELALVNLGMAWFDLGDAANMKKIADEVRAYEPNFNRDDASNLSYVHLIYGYDYTLARKYDAAKKEYLISLDLAQKDSLSALIEQNYVALATIAFAKSDFVRGNYYQLLSDFVNNSIKRTELSEYGADLEKKYETEKKEAQIAAQQEKIKQHTLITATAIAGAIILLLALILVYRNYVIKQKLQQQRISELETEKQLAATEAILKGEEQERTRLAKDLHDGLGGMLSGIKYGFQAIKQNMILTPENADAFERSIDMLDNSIREMRRVAHNMMPENLVKFGLDTALKDFCADIDTSGVVSIHYQSIHLDEASLPQLTSITLYRIVQELINNVLKHAAATTILVQLSKMDDQITITVEDNGCGFDPAALHSTKGMGWSNIYNRVEYVKGKVDIHSAPGEGTSVHIEIPA